MRKRYVLLGEAFMLLLQKLHTETSHLSYVFILLYINIFIAYFYILYYFLFLLYIKILFYIYCILKYFIVYNKYHHHYYHSFIIININITDIFFPPFIALLYIVM